jgi:uncharacterized repeat protein (TIGR03837 family)
LNISLNHRPVLSADLFCQIVDNLGDIGVMWRLARQLTQEKGWHIRLWVDKLEQFKRIERAIDAHLPRQTCQEIEVYQWLDPWVPVTPHPIVIAGFSCALPDEYVKQLAGHPSSIWLQLEYLSAEDWIDSFHGLHSQRNDTLKPLFFFPGFTERTGGLMREHGLLEQRNQWQISQQRGPWLAALGVNVGEPVKLVSVFTYPHAPLQLLIHQLRQTGERFHLLIPSGQSMPSCPEGEQVTWQAIEFLNQPEYDKLLWSCDLNLVRGEDSFMRAIWAGKPMFWQIYPQTDGAHHAKLDAWLKRSCTSAPVASAMHEWADGKLNTDLSPHLTGPGWENWQQTSATWCHELAQQSDLATRLDTAVRRQTGTPDRL